MNNVPLSLKVERWTLDARHGGGGLNVFFEQ